MVIRPQVAFTEWRALSTLHDLRVLQFRAGRGAVRDIVLHRSLPASLYHFYNDYDGFQSSLGVLWRSFVRPLAPLLTPATLAGAMPNIITHSQADFPSPTSAQIDQATSWCLARVGWSQPPALGQPGAPRFLSVLFSQWTVKLLTSLLATQAPVLRSTHHHTFVTSALSLAPSSIAPARLAPVAPPVGAPVAGGDPAPGVEPPPVALPDELGPGLVAVPQAVVDHPPPPPPVFPSAAAAVDHLTSLWAPLWRLPWENHNKEVFWRMALQGVRGAGGHDIVPSGPCPCGQRYPPASSMPATQRASWLREHSFWHCPVAQAVMLELARVLHASGCLPAHGLQAAHVWLCSIPHPSLSASVWKVVCLAALSAVDYGRRRMWALHLAASHNPHTHPGLRQLTMFEAWDIPEPHPHLTPVQRASQAAVASFWRSLHSFVHFHKTPSAHGRPLWPSPEHLRASHPFLCHGVADGSPRLSLSGAPTR
jgi:hypothetical protein